MRGNVVQLLTSFEKQPRGLMFNFSFGGPKDYKKTKTQVAMMDETKAWSVVGFAAVIGIIALTIAKNDDANTVVTELPPETDLPPEN